MVGQGGGPRRAIDASFANRCCCRPHQPPRSLTNRTGVPVIFHDNYVVFGDVAEPTSRLIAELTSQEFCQLAPVNTSASAALDGDVVMGASPTGSIASLASLESHLGSVASSAAASTASSASRASRLMRKHNSDTPAQPHEPTLCAWQCEREDRFPTLADVFAGIAPDVAFDLVRENAGGGGGGGGGGPAGPAFARDARASQQHRPPLCAAPARVQEIKMAMPDDVVVTPPAEVERVVSATLATVDASMAVHGPRTIMFSSFDPEVCVEVKRR